MNPIPTPLYVSQLASGNWLCLMDGASIVIVHDPNGVSAYDRSPFPRSSFLTRALEAIR